MEPTDGQMGSLERLIMPWKEIEDPELLRQLGPGPGPAQAQVPGGGMPWDNPVGQLQGQPLLKYLEQNDPSTAAFVKALHEGKATAGGRNLQQMIPIASAIWDDFDASAYPARLAARKAFAPGGQQAKNVQAYAT